MFTAYHYIYAKKKKCEIEGGNQLEREKRNQTTEKDQKGKQ